MEGKKFVVEMDFPSARHAHIARLLFGGTIVRGF